jgi:hypothetical protein
VNKAQGQQPDGMLLLRSCPVAGEDLQLGVLIGGGDPRVSILCSTAGTPIETSA